MKQLFLKTTLLLFAITFFKCEDNINNQQTFRPTLPLITLTGKNTFGCYIDGKLLIPRDGTGGIKKNNKGLSYFGLGDGPNYIHNEIYIDDRKSEKGSLMRIHLVELHKNGEGTFNINKSNCQNGLEANNNININCRVYDDTEQIYKWYCSIENAGKLTITRYDLNNRIISGTFNCTMQNKENPKDIIEITDGRFDIKWDTLDETIFP
jgi:hypothetical protein